MSDLNTLRNLAIVLIYTILLGTSAFEKLKSGPIPDWFPKQFEKSLLGKFPMLVKLSYWNIAAIEAGLTVLFLTSIFFPGLLSIALLGSLFLFAILCFGLRISYDFQGSANMFTYFTATLVSIYLV